MIHLQKGLHSHSMGGADLLKWALPGGGGVKSAKVAPTPYMSTYYITPRWVEGEGESTLLAATGPKMTATRVLR